MPGWEILYVYQKANPVHLNTVLLLRRKRFVGEPYAVGKIFTVPRERYRKGDKSVNEATALAKIPPHPGIIKLYSTHVDVPRPRQVSLILEVCRGESLRSFSDHARSVRRRIPEVFVWHLLCQTLVALEHLDRNHVSHGDVHSGNLLLRPVEGGVYPDVVIADFEHCKDQSPDDVPNERSDFHALSSIIEKEMLEDPHMLKEEVHEIADDTAPHSQELRNFVRVLSGSCAKRPTALRAEMEQNLIPQAKKMAYGDDKTTPRMPVWMITYFAELKTSKAISS